MIRRIAIVGSRDYPAADLVRAYVEQLPRDSVVISGGATGVDSWAVEVAQTCGLPVEVFPADWARLGRKAGPLRNGQIVAAADRVVAFWNGRSRGTLNTIVQGVRAGRHVIVYGPDGAEVGIQEALDSAEALGVIAGMVAAQPSEEGKDEGLGRMSVQRP